MWYKTYWWNKQSAATWAVISGICLNVTSPATTVTPSVSECKTINPSHLLAQYNKVRERHHEGAKPFTPALLPHSSVWQGEYWERSMKDIDVLHHGADRSGSLTQKTSMPVFFNWSLWWRKVYLNTARHTHLVILHNVFCNQESRSLTGF